MEREEIVEKFSEFLSEFYVDELVTALTENRKSISIDFSLLDRFDVELADCVFEIPDELIEAAEEAVKQIDTGLAEAKLRVRFFNLPKSKEIRIRNIRAEHIGKLLVVDGVVKRASEIRPEVSEGVFSCPECGARISIIQTDKMMRSPASCECGCKRGFKLIDQRMYDARWITVEEPHEVTSGESPSEIKIFLKEDLTSPLLQNRTDPGNRINIIGVLKQTPKRVRGTVSRQLDIYIDANYIEPVEAVWEELDITLEDEQNIIELSKDPLVYEKLVSSIAPAIYGLNEVKEAIILQMFGGERHILKDKTKIRSNIHILLVGDPSCLVADERVVMADGTIMKIGEMGSRHLQKINYRLHMGMGRNCGQAAVFHMYKKQSIIEIITETGKSIKGTHNQPVLIAQNRERVWRRLDEVKIGDKVQILPKIECRKKSLVKTNWVDYSYYHKSWRIRIPKYVDEKLAAIFGYILADGWVEKRRIGLVVNNDESDIVPKIKEFFRDCFDAPIASYKHSLASKKITYYQINRTHLSKLLSFLKEKRVPNYIFQSGNKIVSSFLRWLYEGDGTVFSKGRGRTSISLKSNNIELLRDVQLLLLRFGIHSRISWDEKSRVAKIKDREISSGPSGSLMIRRSESIIKFWKHVGFVSKKKNDKLKIAAEYAKSHIHRVHKKRVEKIVKINKLLPQDVFDVEVPRYHRFVANGIVVHNTAKSQIMKLVSTIMPRGKYASGTGVTGAGLTATVVKDEELMGGWVLEAGALVMANRSVCAIDEFSHVSPSDMSKLQEAMSLETISIAKASIVATLPAQTAILAGGNPKFGRFDPYIPIREQIDINEVLLSRFDLRFALRDVPQPDRDEKIADHILKMRHFESEAATPKIETTLLRKYISYARANVHPVLTKEAGEKLKEFYLQMRSRSGEDAPVSITLRQYDSLIRLSESSARIRLSETVDMEDAQRAINLMSYSLRQFGFEPETGKIDIDRVEGQKMTSVQRSKTKTMIDVINALEAEVGKEIPKVDIIQRAKAEGIDNAEAMLDMMLREGMLYQPNPNVVRKI